MVLLAPGQPQTKPEPPKPEPLTPDKRRILQQARQIIQLGEIIKRLNDRIKNLLNKPQIHYINQLEFQLTNQNRELFRLRTLVIIGIFAGLIGTVPNCIKEIKNTIPPLTKPVK